MVKKRDIEILTSARFFIELLSKMSLNLSIPIT